MTLNKVLSFTYKLLMLLVVSFAIAIYLNYQTNFWAVIEWLPKSIITNAVGFLFSATYLIQPVDVVDQEEFMELLLVWLFSLPIVIPLLIVLYSLVGRFFYSRRRSNL
jgi:hypothetical protein